jgi:hypothetical protein
MSNQNFKVRKGIDAGDIVNAPVFNSTVATGTAPLTVASTTVVTNLNADLLDGYKASALPVSTATQTSLNLKSDLITTVIKDSATGAAFMPSGTTAQRPASPVNGYMRYNSDLLAMEAYVNGFWGSVGGGATGGGTDHVFNNNGFTVTSNYTIPAGMSAVTVGDSNGNVTINSGITVTVSSGSRWVVL